jgi:glucose/mannose-6-phosphate isomerase
MTKKKNEFCAKEHFADLDSAETYKADIHGMYDWIRHSDRPFAEGMSKFKNAIKGQIKNIKDIREILICGMGGSAICGDVANVAFGHNLQIPYRVIRGYSLPSSLGPNTLQIVVSYSGGTEESIWAYTQGHNRSAKIIVLCSGGILKELADRHKHPVITLSTGYPAPRLALSHMSTAIISIISELFGEPEGLEDKLKDTAQVLRRASKKFDKELPIEKNFAKRIAKDLHGVSPVIIGSELTWPAALRFQSQLNENSKWPAHACMIPEMNHNEIVAYTRDGIATFHTGVILLKDKDDHPRVRLRQDFTAGMIEETVSWVSEMKGEGKSPFARVMSLILAADYTSYYFACGRGIDPLEINAISNLKDRLGKMK